MFSGGFMIKNEPITVENAGFLQNVVIKCEKDCERSEYDEHINARTTICSESEYLADGNAPFESIIVKEEPKLNDYDHVGVTTVGTSTWECYICRYVSINTTDLRKHIGKHAKQKLDSKSSTNLNPGRRYFCEQCNKNFASSSSLYNHRQMHKGIKYTRRKKEKTLVCDYCRKLFLNKATLTQHMHIHSGIRRFECNECDRKFTDSSTLYKHKQTHSGDRPFACNLCDRRHSRKSTLARHLKTHTGEKSFTCNICDKKFSRNSTLNHHKLIHTGENPFPCNQCDRKFKIKSTLEYHLKIHSGLLPFRCDKCSRNFMTQTNLNQHKKNNKQHRDRATHHRKLFGDDDDKPLKIKLNSKNVTPLSKRKSPRKI